MNITRHNYEEFFILYMDNELDAEGRLQVEAFVELHPDLKEELETLMQFKLEPDTSVVFPGKGELWKKTAGSPIDISNYESWLLLYVDNELDPSERVLVESFVASNNFAISELSLLQRTRLVPDAVGFEDKQSLYRREERRIPILWWRIAAAILIAALAVSVSVILNNRKKEIPAVAGNKPGKTEPPAPLNKPGDKPSIALKSEKNSDPVLPGEISPANKVTAPQKQQDLVTTDNKKNNKNSKEIPIVIDPIPVKKDDAIANNDNKPSNNLPVPVRTDNTDANRAIASNNIPSESKNLDNVGSPSNVTSPNLQPSDYKAASYTSAADNFSDESKNGKKSKLRGFFRKITRTFEKRTNIDPTTDDNKLLVAGWSINLK